MLKIKLENVFFFVIATLRWECVKCLKQNDTFYYNQTASHNVSLKNLDFQQKLDIIRQLIFLYYLPTIVIIGLIGNTLTIIILSKEKSLLKLYDSNKTIKDNFKNFSNQYHPSECNLTNQARSTTFNSVNNLNQIISIGNSTNDFNCKNQRNSIKSHNRINNQARKKTFTPRKVNNHFSSSNYFIFCVAISDLMYNVVLLLVWISGVGINLVHIKYVCQITIAITYICSFLSAAFTTLFTYQRFMAVSRPLKLATTFSLQSPRFIKKVILVLVIFSLVIYSFSLFLYDNEPKKEHEHTEASSKCGPKESHKNLVLIIDNTLDSMLTLIIPSFGILFMNFAICRSFSNYQKENMFKDNECKVNRLKNKSIKSNTPTEKINFKETTFTKIETARLENINENSTSYLGLPLQDENIDCVRSRSNSVSNISNVVKMNKQTSSNQINSSRHVTKTLMIVSFAFILLNSPFRASQLIVNIRMYLTKSYVYSNFEYAINEVLLNLYFTSYSVNFFLYSLCGRKFRDSFKALIFYSLFWVATRISRFFNYVFSVSFRMR